MPTIPFHIAEKQTTSQPYMIAAMIQAAQIKPEDRVLEIGAGSGYQTALLAELASQVFAVERYASLAEAAQNNFGTAGLSQYKNCYRRWFAGLCLKPRLSTRSSSRPRLLVSLRHWSSSLPSAAAC